MTTEEKIAVMQAFVDGAEIECKTIATFGPWTPLDRLEDVGWDWMSNDYRIKPDRPPQKEFEGFEHTGEWREPEKGDWFQCGDDCHVLYVDPYVVGPRWILRKVEPRTSKDVKDAIERVDATLQRVEPDSKPESPVLSSIYTTQEGVEVWDVRDHHGTMFAFDGDGAKHDLEVTEQASRFIGFLYEHESLDQPEVHTDSQMFAWLDYRGLHASVPLAHIQSGEAVPVRPVGVVMRKGE